MTRVLPGVAEQVLENDPQQRRVAPYLHARGDFPANLALRGTAAQVLGDEAGELRKIDALVGERL
jgi:hypothetical protein